MPLLIAAIGELISERGGVLNMSIEGMMLAGAFGSWATGSPSLGLLCGLLAALPVALAQAVLTVNLRADQGVTGLGLNILVLGHHRRAKHERQRFYLPQPCLPRSPDRG